MKTLLIDMELFRAARHGFLLNLIAFHAGREKNTGCYASYAKIAEEMGRSRETVKKQIAELVKDGWITFQGYKGRCRLIKLTAKALWRITGSTENSASVPSDTEQENQSHRPNPTHVHRSNPTHVHRPNPTPIKYNENTKENSVCVHSASQEEKIQAPQKTEHTHTVSLSKSKRVTRKKEVSPAVPVPSDVEEVKDYAEKTGGSKDQATAFFRYYASTGWTANGNLIYDWKARFDLWLETDRRREAEISMKKVSGNPYGYLEVKAAEEAALQAVMENTDMIWG